MSKLTWDDSVRDVLKESGSSNPTPGGGSVAAIVAALGAAMTSMVSNLTTGEQYASIQQQIAETVRKMNALSAECEKLFHADMDSFNKYMAALKLPKETDEQKAVRKNAIHEATISAIEVPFRLLEACKSGMHHTYIIAETANKNVISDLGIGAILFEAAAQSASLTIEINLASLKDMQLRNRYHVRLSELVRDIEDLKKKTLEITRKRIP